MDLDAKIAEAEREIEEAWDDVRHADRDCDAIYAARTRPALRRHEDWKSELARLRALKSGEVREGER